MPLPDADHVILPGSKATMSDLAFLRAQGWDMDLAVHRRRGGHVLGLCGGFQLLGQVIADPQGIEGKAGSVAGLGLLLSRLTGVTALEGYLATTPGGVYAVLATAISAGVDVTFVVAVQVLRVIVMLLVAPVVARLVAGRGGGRP